MSQRSPLASLSKDSMNINRPTGYDGAQIGMKQSETVNNVLICEQQSPPPAPTVTETVVVQKETAYAPVSGSGCYGRWTNYLCWFFIIFIIAWFLLFCLRPEWVLKHKHHGEHNEHHESECEPHGCNNNNSDHHHHHREVDQIRVLIGAIIIALIAIFIIWLFQWVCGAGTGYGYGYGNGKC